MKKNFISICLMSLLIFSCTFDYGESDDSERTLPDLIMKNVEYVRVRSADPIARIRAERIERYEEQGIMTLENFSFEQFIERGEEVSTAGKAGFASVNIETIDIFMDRDVRIEVESEDITIKTTQLRWNNEQRLLSSGEETEVNIFRGDGTSFTGTGLRIDARRHSWEFSGPVHGTFITEDDDGE